MANLCKVLFGDPARRCFVGALFIAAVIGFIHGSHNILIPPEIKKISPDSVYYPMTVASNYDIGTFYAARAKAVTRGQVFSGDINLAEYPDAPSSVPFLPSAILGGTARILGSLEGAIIFSDFFFPALAFIIIYLLIFRVIKKYWLAICGALFFVFLPGWAILATSPDYSGWRELLFRLVPFFDTKLALIFLRFDYPKLTELFYAAALLLLYGNLRRPGRTKFILASGISLGTLLYIYLYNGLYMFMGLSFLILGLLFLKERARAKTVLGIFGIALAVSIPYWWNLIRLHGLEQYNDILWRLGVEVSHSFRWSSWTSIARAIVLSVLVWVVGGKENRVRSVYLISLLLPIIFALNIQVVTGMNPAPDHWHRVQFLPVALVLLFFIGVVFSRLRLPDKYSLYSRFAPAAFIAIFLSLQLAGQWLFSTNPEAIERYAVPVTMVRSYQWLDRHTPAGSVVGTMSAETDAEVAMYTHNRIYIPRAFNTVASTEEMWKRAIILARILKFSPEEFKGFFGRDSDFTPFMFGDFYRSRELNSVFSNNSRDVPPEVLSKETSSFENDKIFASYKLDYIYIGPRELALYKNSSPDFDNIFGPPVYSDDGIRIYKTNN